MLSKNEINSFVKNHAYNIYLFINNEILNDIAFLYPDYFVKMVQNVLIENEFKETSLQNIQYTPYILLSNIFKTGQIPYTSLRTGTMDFSLINKESKTYYNYIQFSLRDEFIHQECMGLELIQSKIGGMPIDNDIVKYTKLIPIKLELFDTYINNNTYNNKEEYIKITHAINKLFSTTTA